MNLPCSFCKRNKNGVSKRFDSMTDQHRLLCRSCATYKALQFWELHPEKVPALQKLPDGTLFIGAREAAS